MNKVNFFTGQPIFTQLLKFLPKHQLNRISKSHQSDYYIKKFDSFHHLVTMLFATFQKCESLRSVIIGMLAWEERLRHLGLTCSPCRSTLADANERRDCKYFESVYYHLLEVFQKRVLPDSRPKKHDKRLRIMDSSTFELFTDVMTGAGKSKSNGKKKGGVKAHMLIDYNHQVPQICYFSEARHNDRIFLEKISVPAGSILVFDRGYTKHSQWQRWTEQGIFWITRLNKNAYYQVVQTLSLSIPQIEQGVISDQIILLGKGTTASTEIIPARLIVFYDKEKKKTFSFITNHETLKPATIARFYKKRWTIETHFKSIKQNFQLRYFLGDTPNAIQIQLWCALIADLLIKLIQHSNKGSKWSFSNLCALVRINLGTYVNLFSFIQNPEKSLLAQIKSNRTQLKLKFSSA